MRRVILSLLCVFAIDAAGQCPGFGTPAVFPTNTTGTFGTVAADFNGDGNLDLAATSSEGDSVSILLGTGMGTFAAPVSFPAGDGPYNLVSADFNEDGAADLAVVLRDQIGFSILLGNGAGTFAAPVIIPTAKSLFTVATGDFNEDGHADLAFGGSSGISIYAGTGTGSFGGPLIYPGGETPWDIAVADLDGDGNLDLAVADRRRVAVLRGTGAGTFTLPVFFPVAGQEPQAIAAGDFDGDGDLDLATANTESETISVLLNLGFGTFAAPVTYSTRQLGDVNTNETYPNSIVAADLTGDGILDLAVTTFGRGLVVFTGTGSGTFGATFPVPPFTLGPAVRVIAADFDEDGSMDLAVTSILPGAVRILLNMHECAAPIPALSPLALLALSVMIGAAGLLVLRR